MIPPVSSSGSSKPSTLPGETIGGGGGVAGADDDGGAEAGAVGSPAAACCEVGVGAGLLTEGWTVSSSFLECEHPTAASTIRPAQVEISFTRFIEFALSYHSNPAFGGWLFLDSGRESAHHLVDHLADRRACITHLTHLGLQDRVLSGVQIDVAVPPEGVAFVQLALMPFRVVGGDLGC